MLTVVENSLPLANLQLLSNEPQQARQATLALVLTMNDTDEEIRAWAADALENMGVPPSDVGPQLAELARHATVPVAGWACKLLGRLGAEGNRYQANLVATAQQHADTSVRQEAVAALGKIGQLTDCTQEALRKLEKGNDPRLKRMIATALAK